MIRGGDTPKQETLWAIEFESGKFAFGHANENEIFVATSGIGRQIWYADGNGVITGSTESIDEVTSTIIDTYNENFGTNISHLTPETKIFEVGNTVQNWNAYEKIEMPPEPIKFKVPQSNGRYWIIWLVGDTLKIQGKDNRATLLWGSANQYHEAGALAGTTDKADLIAAIGDKLDYSSSEIVLLYDAYPIEEIVSLTELE